MSEPRIFDIVFVDDVECIVTEIVNGRITETTPLQDYIIDNRVIQIGSEEFTIRELIEKEMEKFRGWRT
jgi:hypothetical protein